MAKTRGQGMKPGRIPKSVQSQGDMYRHDGASALGGPVRGVKGSMGGKS